MLLQLASTPEATKTPEIKVEVQDVPVTPPVQTGNLSSLKATQASPKHDEQINNENELADSVPRPSQGSRESIAMKKRAPSIQRNKKSPPEPRRQREDSETNKPAAKPKKSSQKVILIPEEDSS
ncbi:hypothetical protein BLNAU_22854 [Blattamonas nauphoetae]|uniref:Uncharacterized protein n=1 Tax=Blattamonas nauphoetae TaxID=2049346 RepID=A0ABQ9WRX7_9EUKA|nr:hypothetical protein BLNAU_22854 [Blattamonas nauphoetae]